RVPILICGLTIEGPPNTPETLCLAMDLSERRRAEERVRSIVECSKILASSLDCEDTFPQLAQFVVSKLADSCAIFIEEDNRLVPMAAAGKTIIQPTQETEQDLKTVLSTGNSKIILSPGSCALIPIMARGAVSGV